MSGPFKLRSGNTTPFKQMGSSPVKQNGMKWPGGSSLSNPKFTGNKIVDFFGERAAKINASKGIQTSHTAADSTAAYNRAKERLRLEKQYEHTFYDEDFHDEMWDLRQKNIEAGIYVTDPKGKDPLYGWYKYGTGALEKTVHTLKPKEKEVKTLKPKGVKPKVKLIKMPVKQPKLIKTSSHPKTVLKPVDIPKYTGTTVNEDLSKEFHHRKYKEEDGKYSMFNPTLGKWKPITKKSYNFGIKNSTYNKETGVHDRWWQKGTDHRTGSITEKSGYSKDVLKYLKSMKQ